MRVFSEDLYRKPQVGGKQTYLSIDGESAAFLTSISEPVCYFLLVVCVCILILGLKHISDLKEERKRHTRGEIVKETLAKPIFNKICDNV